MQFLWFNVLGPDNGFELRQSIRSVKQNFVGDSDITVMGESPNWYKGHFIPVPKIVRSKVRGHPHRSVHPDRLAFTDTANKMTIATTHPEIQDEFIWMMDDNFLIRPTTLCDLQIPRYDPWYKANRGKQWHALIAATFAALKAKGKPNLQYGTHLPHHFEKQKMAELFELYGYPGNLYLFEILYGNHYRTGEQPYGHNWQGVEYPQFLKRLLKRPRNSAEMETLTSASNVLNYQAVCYCNHVKAWLEAKFPEPSNCE